MTKRNYKEGIDRQQAFLLPPKVEEYVSEDNPVRAIDTYVESLDLHKLGFRHASGELTPGQPAFAPQALLKLYLYGYLHRIRSSRRLAAECVRNLEVIWLLEGLQPGYKTIADFRKNNPQALTAVNRDFVQLCKELGLFGAELVGIDGSFFRGNVAKKSIYTAARLERSLAYIEKDITKYLSEMEQADEQEGDEPQTDPKLQEKLQKLRERQKKRTEQLKQLEASGQTQISEVDPDARLLTKGGGTTAGYNVQTAVDAKHKLLIYGEVVQDGNDKEQLLPMGQAAKHELGLDALTTVQDEGYFNAGQIKACQENGITPYVPEVEKYAHARKAGRFTREDFSYDAAANAYICPAQQTLKFVSTHPRNGKNYHRYSSSVPVCRACALKDQCLPEKNKSRMVTRWEHEEIIEAHRVRMDQDGAEKMRRRAELCEHPFGTLKLWCGWTHFLVRGLRKVRGEFSLLMLSYNFRRALNILGIQAFRAYCRQKSTLGEAMSC